MGEVRDSAAIRQWAFDVGDRTGSLRTYRTVRRFCQATLNPYLRLRSENTERLDRPGPLILAPVHRSHLDTVVIAGSCTRRLRALGKESLFTKRGVGWLCATLGAIPVRRGEADKEALKAAKALLERNEALFVFPEGGRFASDDPVEQNTVQPLFDGAAWLASRTGADVVPIGVAGTAAALAPGSKLIHRSDVGIWVGEALPAPTGNDGGRARRADLTSFTETLRVQLQNAQDRAVELAEAS